MKMKKLSIAFIFCVVLSQFNITAQEWHTHIDTVKNIATEESKNILLVFQGSDWCAPCIKLEKKVWSKEVFLQYAEENLVLLQADFPKRKKNALPELQQDHNHRLAEQYNPNGIFPLVVIIDSVGNVIAETGYKKMKADDYVAHLQEISQ